MPEIAKIPNSSAALDEHGRYFKMQIRGWTDFDPSEKTFPEIVQAIERGGGFLTAIDVVEVKEDLSAINDNAVREGFQTILAARRVLRNVAELPTGLIEDLRAALDSSEKKSEKSAAFNLGVKQAS